MSSYGFKRMVEGIIMKFLILLLSFIVSLSAWSEDPVAFLNSVDSKIYSLKTKGVKDFVVDIESSKLTRQMNEQMMFGKVDEVIFRTYWTANPERIAIEVIGLPDGFKEIKEELKLSIFNVIENLLPPSTVQRFAGYKIIQGAKPKEFVAQDSTGIANIPSFTLRFDSQDRLTEVEGHKPVGFLMTTPKYEKDGFSGGKWVLKSISTKTIENGQSVTVSKDLKYGSSQGIGVLSELVIKTEQKLESVHAKPLILEEAIEFKNYKINAGEALKYFLGDSAK